MTVRGKEELKEFFKTGEIPSGEKFADFIDSYIASINGNMPDEDGNVMVPIPFAVNPGIPVDGAPNLYPLGRTIGMFDYVPGQNAYVDELYEGFNIPETTITVITDRFGTDGRSVIIQQVDLMQDGAFIPVLTRSSNVEQTEWGPLQFIASVRKINGQTPDLNGEITIESGPQGPQGEQGPQGPAGPAGPQGEQGEQGLVGPPGPQGPQGMQGERGEKGETGQGLDIKASYQTLAEGNADIANIADNTFVYISADENSEGRGTVYFKHDGATALEKQFVAEGIKGEKGETGERGEQGPIGLQGAQGPQGARGIQGVPGPQGPIGPQGPKGDSSDITPKDFYQAWRTGSGQTATNGNDIILNSEGFGRGINYDNSTGIWTLLPGKIYKMDVNLRANTSNFLEFGVYSHSTSSYVSDIMGAAFSVNSTFNTSSISAITQFIDSNVHQSISIRCINASNNGATVTVGFSHATIVEI